MSLQTAVDRAQADQQHYLEQLIQLLRIPSISALRAHQEDVRQAATWLATDMSRMGLANVRVIETAGNPVVFGEWDQAGRGAPTLLLYGHYDVQPVDPLALWQSPPFEPTMRDGKLFARGASDNKAQFFTHMKAVDAMLRANGRLPLNVKFCLDGEEEVGSPNLEPFVTAHRELLAADVVVISDGGMVDEGQPSIDYALRGIITADLLVDGPQRDLHSGSFGGSVHNPVQALAEIIAALHDDEGHVTIPGFYDDVVSLSDEERQLLSQVPYGMEQWKAETGAQRLWGEPGFTLLERMTARPTLEINGIWGGFQEEGFKTIIPAKAGAKISMRLVARQDPATIARQFEEHIRRLAPPTVSIGVNVQAGAPAAVTAYDSAYITAATRALEATWNATPVLSRGGGSLPIVAAFQRELGAPFVLMPLGLDDNRHSPNEHYRIDSFFRGIETVIHFYHYAAEGG